MHIPPSPAISNVNAHPPASLVLYQAQQAAQSARASSGSTNTKATPEAIELDIANSVSADRDPQGGEYANDEHPPDDNSAKDALAADPDPTNLHRTSVSQSAGPGLDIVG